MLSYTVEDILREAAMKGASDLHLTVGVPPMIRVNGSVLTLGDYPKVNQEIAKSLVYSIVNEERAKTLEKEGDVDFSFILEGIGRFRVNAFKQRNSYCLAIRLLVNRIPTMDELGLPLVLKELAAKPRGLVLVTGPTGSGKSTTLASMIDFVNKTRRAHVITIEDPIEYLYKHGNCIINQREVGDDTSSFSRALRSAMREDPDVILVGEMRDLETIQAAITAAETGHLVFSTLHTKGAASTVDRMIDVFPPEQQRQIRIQLSNVLEGVITQNLVLRADAKGRALAMEIMVVNDAIRNMIRDEKVHQINSAIQTNAKLGMQTLDAHLALLVKQGIIALQEAINSCINLEDLKRYL
ncbi:type IV pilus twitching motility protein PilT [Niameybacter massiliensis]|uniref:Type IV pilus twitching motility protein PilT n=1 Tax=Holtiella tumoricola TaxID=3018743 RepID=A0AA42DRR2_9FIRM|nr:type IV pilus twitching motility protein PilT [Holtiella tumoricola]MDA3733792.1 type IV pilus twitching motility protein PilT [Holtiella tumoricola]